jgi:hypothetical protein
LEPLLQIEERAADAKGGGVEDVTPRHSESEREIRPGAPLDRPQSHARASCRPIRGPLFMVCAMPRPNRSVVSRAIPPVSIEWEPIPSLSSNGLARQKPLAVGD